MAIRQLSQFARGREGKRPRSEGLKRIAFWEHVPYRSEENWNFLTPGTTKLDQAPQDPTMSLALLTVLRPYRVSRVPVAQGSCLWSASHRFQPSLPFSTSAFLLFSFSRPIF
jgi:hypothetical protein